MNRILNIFILLLLLSVCSVSAETNRKEFEGYIIKLNNDTVPVKLALPYSEILNAVDKYRMCDVILMVLPNGGTKRVKPEEVLGYSYKNQGQWYHYYSYDLSATSDTIVPGKVHPKHKGGTSQVKFLRRIIQGKAILYVYESEEAISTDANASNQGNAAMEDEGYGIGNTIRYYIEKDHRMTPIAEENFRNTMLKIVSDDDALAKKVYEKEYMYKDLKKIVEEYNSTFY